MGRQGRGRDGLDSEASERVNDGRPRCPHGYRVVLKIEDGWRVPYANDCPRCPPSEPCGARFKLPEDHDVPPEPAPIPASRSIVECPSEGCCLLVERKADGEIVPHTAPCLDPDVTARIQPIPLAVEIDESSKWHAPREWSSNYVVSYCGRRGRPTDHSELDDLVDCKTCLNRRPE